MAELKLSDLVKDKYKMKGSIAPGTFHFKGAKIDMATVTLEVLEEAIEKGFDVVMPIKQTKKEEAK